MKRQRVFISYRRSDSAGHAGRLNADLTRRLGSRVFMDISDIAPGDEFERVIDEQLRSCGVVLAVIGPQWRDALRAPRDGKDYVRLELRQALHHEGVSVIPVLIEAAALPLAGELPEDVRALAGRQAVSIRDDRWKDDVEHLARRLRSVLGLSRIPRWLISAAAALLAIAATATWLLMPPEPSAFDRKRAHDVTTAAVRKAAVACGVGPGAEGECPILMEFEPSGRVQTAYFDTGACRYKGMPFGDCILRRLEKVRIPPFDNVPTAQVEVGIRIDASGAVDVFVDE